jgi:hypothetical protein
MLPKAMFGDSLASKVGGITLPSVRENSVEGSRTCWIETNTRLGRDLE